MTAIGVFRYWPRTKAIPKGWEFVSDFGNSSHARYSILIRKIAG